jgi:hypothetical protein
MTDGGGYGKNGPYLGPEKLVPANTYTVDEYRKALEALRENDERIRKMVSRYPVFIYIAETGYRFESENDMNILIADLKLAITAWESKGQTVLGKLLKLDHEATT